MSRPRAIIKTHYIPGRAHSTLADPNWVKQIRACRVKQIQACPDWKKPILAQIGTHKHRPAQTGSRELASSGMRIFCEAESIPFKFSLGFSWFFLFFLVFLIFRLWRLARPGQDCPGLPRIAQDSLGILRAA